MTITVYGQPAPQGSKRHVGRGVLIESSKAVAPWRQAVCYAARQVSVGAFGCALKVSLTFTLAKPKSALKRQQSWPEKRPDVDKLTRSTFDALTDAGVWRDDGQVVELVAAKRYPNEGVDALDSPGAVIRIEAIT